MSLPAERPHRLTTADGVALHALLATPASPAGVLILCHGIATNLDEHGQFPALRDRALRSGLAVVRFDFRAHGQSTGSNQDLRLAGMHADADAVLALVDAELPSGLPVVPLGVSFGASAAVHLAAAGRCAGLVLWYPVVDYAANFDPESPAPWMRLMWAARSDADPDWSALPLIGTDHHVPTALLAELQHDRTPDALANLPVPVLAFQGSRDKLLDPRPLRALASGGADIELHFLPGAGHGFILWRPWVVRRTVGWAHRRATAVRR